MGSASLTPLRVLAAFGLAAVVNCWFFWRAKRCKEVNLRRIKCDCSIFFLSSTDYVTWNGPDPDLRRGSKSCAKGPNPALRRGPASGANGGAGGLARGADPSLRRGPAAGRAKGSMYAACKFYDDDEGAAPPVIRGSA